ncbi:PBP1A family penicillin-binding protein [Pararhizobium sp. BT-229]|uniref:PBP1A family penicillin-binding protein n=1 Tax=Pararhizobium sp. BT-229 TaxID=2986923 RepID=UPI0021F79C4F|nr:PBP1A family penicillin-binding protein [Pararhizobium sp. BT-229]MCV9967452.1 PBP1A family penicillin-binding protein [Pararhizobium sp. BT-229]
MPSFKRVRWRSWRAFSTLVSVSCLLVSVSILFWTLKDVPWREIADGSLKPTIALETADGQPLVRQGPFQGPRASYEQFPQDLVDAVLSIEDRRFLDHYGIDLRGISRALVRNFQAGEVVQGGSTITQQLIKVLYLENDRTLKRKIQELVIAFWLEWNLGKQEILTRYLNSVYLGAGATGMPAAARIYFNKDIGALDIRESAMLAGLLKAPSQLNPIDNFDGARQRTTTVLDAMVENGKLTPDEAKAAKAEFAALDVTTPTPRSGSWFADWVSGQTREIAGASPGSITVRTTLIPRLQQAAEEIISRAIDEEGTSRGVSQAALVAMTPDGAVVAMVGGRDYKASQFNRAVTAMRQPGSTFKLFVFYAALKKGFTLGDRIDDRPIEIEGWSPENSGSRYRGRVTLAEAFARSLNAATVALAQEVGMDNVAAAAKELGIDASLTKSPALALGASEVNLLDLTGAYASVRAGRSPIEPWGVIDFQAEGQPRGFRIGPQINPSVDISEYQPDLVTLLQLVVERGTGRAASPDVFAAGKTGTSQNNRDAWFVGFTQPLVAGVWVGNDDGTPMKGVTGGDLPARIWREFMQVAMADASPYTEPATDSSAGGKEAAPLCNIRACSQNYRSFRVSDCTYQPYRGQRRYCEK